MTTRAIDLCAGFLTETQFRDLPEPVVRRACLVLADTMGVLISGGTTPDAAALAALYPAQEHGATLFGLWKRIDPLHAILVNASSAAEQELTEGNRFARGHLAVQVVPAILAQAELAASSGADTVATFVVAYELAARIGMASQRFYEVYGHGTWGVLGSALACARLRGYSAARVLEAVRIASTLSLAPLFETHFAGATVRNTFAGIGGMIGWTAADLAQAGYLGLDDGIERTFGQILGSAFNPALFADGLGEDYLIERNYFKFHACGRHGHPALDAFEAILAEGDVTAETLDAVEVETYFPASRKKARQVRTSVDARVSIPYAIASRLVLGTTSARAYTPEALRDPRIQRWMQRVSVTEDPAMTARQPAQRQARVRVRLADGSTIERRCDTQPRGEFDEPLGPGALEEKFIDLTAPRLGERAAQELWDELLHLDERRSMRDLIGAIWARAGA